MIQYIEIIADGTTNYNLANLIGAWEQLQIERVNIVCDSTAGAINIALPRVQDLRGKLGFNLMIVDAAGTAASNNITITVGSGDKVNANATSLVITTAYGSVFLNQSKNNQSTTGGTWQGLSPEVGAGTVTTFTAGNLSPLFTSNVANPTTAPALSFTLSTQTANLVYAGPATGIAAAPTFRALVTADLPAGIGTVTSVSSGNLSPLFTTNVATATTTPALSFTLSTQTANLVFAGPATGIPAAPTFRALVSADMPAGIGTVTSFSSGNLSPLFTTSVATATTTPALSFTLTNQETNFVFAGPATGSPGAPTFRLLVAEDLPNRTNFKVVTSSAGTLTLGDGATTYVGFGTTSTWSLPTIGVAPTNQVYFLKNRGSGNITLNVTGGGTTIYNTAAVTSITILPGEAFIVICDGTYWLVM